MGITEPEGDFSFGSRQGFDHSSVHSDWKGAYGTYQGIERVF